MRAILPTSLPVPTLNETLATGLPSSPLPPTSLPSMTENNGGNQDDSDSNSDDSDSNSDEE